MDAVGLLLLIIIPFGDHFCLRRGYVPSVLGGSLAMTALGVWGRKQLSSRPPNLLDRFLVGFRRFRASRFYVLNGSGLGFASHHDSSGLAYRRKRCQWRGYTVRQGRVNVSPKQQGNGHEQPRLGGGLGLASRLLRMDSGP